MADDLLHTVEAFIRKERERLLKKKSELASTGRIQEYLLIDRDIEVMEVTARKLRRHIDGE